MVDVALAFRVTAGRRPTRARLARAAGLAELAEAHLDRLAVLAGLHDAGKLLRPFQDKAAGGAPAGHVAELLAALMALAPVKALLPGTIDGWFGQASQALYAAACHHGGPVAEERFRPLLAVAGGMLARTAFGHDPIVELERLAGRLRATFPGAAVPAAPIPWTAGLSHLFAGLLMAADWLGSDRDRLPWTDGVPVDPDDRRRRVAAALDATGWDRWSPCPDPVAALGLDPRPGQVAILRVPLDERLVLLEAMTGEGKTEAALLHALRLVEAGRVDGLYFAVPTRSAATELHARIAALTVGAHPGLAGKILRAVPGQLDTDGLARDVADDDDPSRPALGTWALGCPRRALAAPVAVGTIDQALMSVLRARHAWMRRGFLGPRLLVIDEIHAGDAYMLSLVERLAHTHLDQGGHVLGMSATLGESARARLERRSASTREQASGRAYPAVTAGAHAETFASARTRELRVGFVAADEASARIRTVHRSGRRVLVIRSTVADALAVREALGTLGPILHHSRYADQDRRILDGRVLAVLGKDAPQGRGCAVVATQTCEQSLDIDADLLMTDACPADVLLQRAGRTRRHAKGHAVCEVLVIDPGPGDRYLTGAARKDDRLPGQRGLPGQGWAWVYPVLPVVATVEALVRAGGVVRLPEDARDLVEAATHDEALAVLADRGPAWAFAWRGMRDVRDRRTQTAAAEWIDWSRPYWWDQCPSATAVTRLADGSVTVPTPGLVSPLDGAPVAAMPVPSRWLRGVPPGTEAAVGSGSIVVGDVRMTYTELGLQRVGVEEHR